MTIFMILSYTVPVAVWIIWKRKTDARTFPLIVGMISYMFISVLRGTARIVILNDSLKETPWLYYLVSAILSGVFEEVGRYVVFRWCIPDHDRWTDCVSYGMGHGGVEILLTHDTYNNDFWGSVFVNSDFARGMLFSAAMTVLVFAAVHYSIDFKKLLLTAILLHTIVDIYPAFWVCEKITINELDFIDHLYIALVSYFAYRVYRYYRERHESQFNQIKEQ